jgi:hypothetical protein
MWPSSEPSFPPPGSLNWAPVKRDAPFPALLPLSPTVSCKRTPSLGSALGPLQRETHLSTEPSTPNLLKIHLSLRVPGKGAPSMFPNRVPMEKDALSPEPLVCLFMYVCQSPQKQEPSYNMGKNMRSLSVEPHTGGRPTYCGVQPGSPRGSLTTVLYLPQCLAALGTIPSILPWVYQSPLSQHVSQQPSTGYTLHACYRLLHDPG